MWPGPYGDFGSRKYLLVVARPEPRPPRARLRRHLLLAPARPRDARRGDDGRARERRAPGQGALRRASRTTTPSRPARPRRPLSRPRACRCSSTSRGTRCSTGTSRTGSSRSLEDVGAASIVFSPLAQGLLTDRYLSGDVPADSRAATSRFLSPEKISAEYLERMRGLDAIAKERGQSIAQLALSWVLRRAPRRERPHRRIERRPARAERRRARRGAARRRRDRAHRAVRGARHRRSAESDASS